jgi:hypothetical protein
MSSTNTVAHVDRVPTEAAVSPAKAAPPVGTSCSARRSGGKAMLMSGRDLSPMIRWSGIRPTCSGARSPPAPSGSHHQAKVSPMGSRGGSALRHSLRTNRDQWLRDSAWILIAMLLRVAAGGIAATPAQAALSTCGTVNQKHVGSYYNPTSVHVRGVRATIMVRDADLCGTGSDQSWSWSWDMLVSDDYRGWAQHGFVIKNYGSVFLRFRYQYIGCSTCPLVTADNGTPYFATTNEYTVSRYPSDGHIHGYIDGNANCTDFTCFETPWDPINDENWPGLQDQFYGEVVYPQSDVTGSSSYRTNFTQMQNKDSNDNWSYISQSTLNTNSSTEESCFSVDFPTPTQTEHNRMRTWTNDTSHSNQDCK